MPGTEGQPHVPPTTRPPEYVPNNPQQPHDPTDPGLPDGPQDPYEAPIT
ncbi:MAG: hypothetical protein IPG72_03155 [Ardenticatenales bacterium]|nr:hypothetical protein [Ardenticatenales bacterium]